MKYAICIIAAVVLAVYAFPQGEEPLDDGEDRNVYCPGGVYFCPDGYSCCAGLTAPYICCPYVQAVCCADRVHCCPYGFACAANNTCSSATCDAEFPSVVLSGRNPLTPVEAKLVL